MECKNCGHELIKVVTGYIHTYKRYKGGKPAFESVYKEKCFCGCTKPEPKERTAAQKLVLERLKQVPEDAKLCNI